MKRLLLLRHAKAVPHAAMPDLDRVLAEAGRTQMEAMARYLAGLKKQPELALVSPSARTRETWQRAELPDVPVEIVDGIYEASHTALLAIARAIPDAHDRAIMVGHNPGFEEFALSLPDAKTHLRTLSTGALVIAEWRVERWDAIRFGDGRLVRVVTPASLGAQGD